jgi:hypothetical protein
VSRLQTPETARTTAPRAPGGPGVEALLDT